MEQRVKISSLSRIRAPGGDVLHAIKHSDAGFEKFGEAYFSVIHHQTIKAWKKHKRITMNLVVPVGQVRFVFFFNNEFMTIDIGEANYQRLTVLPHTWFGFQGLGSGVNLVLNVASEPHDPDEIERLSLDAITYDWNIK